jgi:predicted membrane channel-forming protein YqfA (hemolysin III family)
MQWGVAILFVLVVLMGVAQYVQTHMALSMMVVGMIIAAIVAYFIGTAFLAGGGEEKEH